MKLSTGKVAFPIEFDNGDKEVIYFNPNDPNLAVRLSDLEDKVQNRIKEIGDIELNENGEPKEVDFVEGFKKIQKAIFDEMNFAFGGDICEKVFKHCSPFAIVDGQYFINIFLDAITPEIEKHIKKANADIELKKQQYLSKYKK